MLSLKIKWRAKRARYLTQLALLLGCLSPLAHASTDCGVEIDLAADLAKANPRHHPIAVPLPRTADFNQPTGCADGAWFYDTNGNARPDPGEPKLFGPRRVTACSSCHAVSPDPKSEAATDLLLRQDAGNLCLVCHRL